MTDTTKPISGRAGSFTPDDGSQKRHGFPALSFQTVEARDAALELLGMMNLRVEQERAANHIRDLRDARAERDAALEKVRELEDGVREILAVSEDRERVTRLQGEVEQLNGVLDDEGRRCPACDGYMSADEAEAGECAGPDCHWRSPLARELTAARERIEALESALLEAMSIGFDGCLMHHTRDSCPGCVLKRKARALLTPTPKDETHERKARPR